MKKKIPEHFIETGLLLLAIMARDNPDFQIVFDDTNAYENFYFEGRLVALCFNDGLVFIDKDFFTSYRESHYDWRSKTRIKFSVALNKLLLEKLNAPNNLQPK